METLSEDDKLKNGVYRLLELDKDKKRAYLCSASEEEIRTGKYPDWTYERRNRFDTKWTDKKLREKAEKRGYKVLPREQKDD